MRFWDASALVTLLLVEPASAACWDLYREDPEVGVWWGSELECASAICRREREGVLDARLAQAALVRLDATRARWDEVQPMPVVRREARRLLRVHALRSADAAQLAAAVLLSDRQPASLPFVCLDDRLTAAAEREGFVVVPAPTPDP